MKSFSPNNSRLDSPFITILITALFLHIDSSLANKRVVFPFDFVRFTCLKPLGQDLDDKVISPTLCTWKILSEGSNNTWTQVTKDCTKTDNRNQKGGTEGPNDVYEGYVEIPEKATTIACERNDGSDDVHLPLDVQQVTVVSPLSRYSESNPRIILQRVSDDFGARLGAHDVTNKEIKINGEEVDTLKLLCIHSAPVSWKNVTESHRRVLAELNARDHKWLLSKSGKLEQSWRSYLRFLIKTEEKSFRESSSRVSKDQVTYTTTLIIQNVTSMTGRTYECADNMNNVTSNVSLRVENPRVVGPDEIHMIEQILTILDSMAQGKGNGREPWYTLGSLMSIILILFMYYCKKKLDQPQAQTPSKPNSPGTGAEETEMRTRLHQNSSQSRDPGGEDPISVVAEQR